MPQPRLQGILEIALSKRALAAAALIAAINGGAHAAEHSTGSYAGDLSRIYEATQFIQAVKVACDGAYKKTAPANAAAYNAWRRRHRELIEELDRRFTQMIRGASTDEKDYSKNIGKYVGAVVQHREALKQQFLSFPAEDVQRQCQEFPQYLRSDEADLPKRFAEELISIRKRKL